MFPSAPKNVELIVIKGQLSRETRLMRQMRAVIRRANRIVATERTVFGKR